MTRYSEFGQLDIHQAINHDLLEFVRPRPQDDVLDVGCGSGELLRLLPEGDGARIGVDPDRDVLEQAAVALGDSARLINAPVEKLLDFVAPESVDVVLAANCIHLFDDIPAAVDLLSAVLRPGGAIGISTAYYTDAVDPSQRPLYTRILRAAQRASRDLGAVPRRSARDRTDRRQLDKTYYETTLSSGSLQVETVREVERDLDREFLTAIATTPVFATGALPGVDVDLAVEAARTACRDVLGSFDSSTTFARRWLYIVARKGNR